MSLYVYKFTHKYLEYNKKTELKILLLNSGKNKITGLLVQLVLILPSEPDSGYDYRSGPTIVSIHISVGI